MKIVNIDGENFDIFWTSWGISIKILEILSNLG